jgi:hypothetical protein
MSLTYSLLTPSLLLPVLPQGGTISVNAASLPLTVRADVNTGVVMASIVETGEVFPLTAYTQVTSGGVTQGQFTGNLPLPGLAGTYTLTLAAQDAPVGPSLASPLFSASVIVASMADLAVAYPPASVSVLQLYDRIRIQWANVNTPGFLGVQVQTSTDSSGVSVPYTQFGGLVPNNNTSSQTSVLASSSSTQQSSLNPDSTSTKTLTVQQTLQLVTYSSVDILYSQINADQFFVLVATVVQDPNTHQVYQSAAAGPFTCSFVNLGQVSPADFPPTTQPEQIAGDIITLVAQEYGGLDQSPRSETRDLQVDPFSLELANATIRSWFTRASASLSALCQIDDANGDGVSDPAATSQVKQAIAKAFRVTDTQVQTLIDNQFDVHAERAGIPRKGPQAAIIPVTFYSMTAPQVRISEALASIVASVPDASTASVTYQSLASGLIDPANLNAYWIPELSGWGFTVDCQATSAGSSGNVGAGTIRTVVSGLSSPMLCTNLTTATVPGQDQESNAALAARIRIRQITGIDSGTAGGYYGTAMASAGVIAAQVVQAGDLEMLRDWDPLRQRHTYGCVDIYTRGGNFSQVTQATPYLLATGGSLGVVGTYVTLSFAGLSGARIKFTVPTGITDDVAAIEEVWLDRTGGVYLGVTTAAWDPQTGALYLNPNDLSYSYNTDGSTTPGAANSAWLTGLTGVTVSALLRTWSPLQVTPSQEPVQAVISVVGNGSTGALPTASVILDKTASDPLLTGNSPSAGDVIRALNGKVTVNTQLTWATNGLLVLDLGEGVYVPTLQVDPNTDIPAPGNITSVRPLNGASIYQFGIDYTLVILGPYNHFGISRPTGSAIPLDTAVNVSYQSYQLVEHLTLQADSLTLTGSAAVPLSFPGFVQDVHIPVSHGQTALTQDADLIAAQVTYLKRYLKVYTTNPSTGGITVYLEGSDYTLRTDPVLGPVLSKFVSGTSSPSRIADSTVLSVSYYTAEVFTAAYTYPEFLTQVVTDIGKTKHGGADTLVKAMTANQVDMALTVTLANSPNATAAIMDPQLRTAISLAISMASGQLSQSDVVYLVRALTGVVSIDLPLDRFAKADGSYVIGEVIPTGTAWVSPSSLNLPTSLFPVQASSWVTQDPVLAYSTRPSGAGPDTFAGLLYQGQSYRRCFSLTEFSAASDLAFYLIGVNDQVSPTTPVASQHYGKVLLNVPGVATSPTALPYWVTYQVYGEASAQDIGMSPLEYLLPGQVTITYQIEGN